LRRVKAVSERVVSLRAQFIGAEAEQARNRFTKETQRQFSQTSRVTQQAAQSDARAFQTASLALQDYRKRFDPAIQVTGQMTDELARLGREAGLTEDQARDFANEIAFLTDKGEDLETALNGAVDKLETYQRQTRGASDESRRAGVSFNSLRGIVGALGIAFGATQAIALFKRQLGESIQASFAHEKALNVLSFALANTDQAFRGSTRIQHEWAESLQDSTGVQSDQILSMQAVAINMGASVALSRTLVQASLDLATATNKDVNTAFLQLAQTLGGYAGELGKSLPEVKALTREQLLLGGAAEVAAAEYAGAAASVGNTRQGLIAKAETQTEDLRRALGDFLTVGDEESIIARFTAIGKGAEEGLDNVSLALDEISDKKGGLALVLAQLQVAADFLARPLGGGLGRQLGRRGEELQREQAQLRRREGPAADPFVTAFGIDTTTMDAIAKGATDFRDSLNSVRQEFDRFRESLREPEAIFQTLAATFPLEQALSMANDMVTQGLTVVEAQKAAAAEQERRTQAQAELQTLQAEAEQRLTNAVDLFSQTIAGRAIHFAGPTIEQLTMGRQPTDEELGIQPRPIPGKVTTVDDVQKAYDAFVKHQEDLERKRWEMVSDDTKENIQQAAQLGETITRTFLKGITSAQNFGDVLDSVFQAVLDAIIQKASQSVGEAIFGAGVKAALTAATGGAAAPAFAADPAFTGVVPFSDTLQPEPLAPSAQDQLLEEIRGLRLEPVAWVAPQPQPQPIPESNRELLEELRGLRRDLQTPDAIDKRQAERLLARIILPELAVASRRAF
jgi:hypothetical protein